MSKSARPKTRKSNKLLLGRVIAGGRSGSNKHSWAYKATALVIVFGIVAFGSFRLLFSSAVTGNTLTYSGTLTANNPTSSYSINNAYAGTLGASFSYAGNLSNASLSVYTATGSLVTQASGVSPVSVLASVAANTSYKFTVSGTVKNRGNSKLGSVSYTLSITPPGTVTPPTDTTPPSAPTNLSANAVSTSQVNLQWTASTDNSGVAGYYLYRNGIKVTTVTTTSYSDVGLSPATAFSYYVQAYDATGNVSAASATTIATTQSPPDTTPPAVTINTPAAGSTLAGTVSVGGTTSDNVGVSSVAVQVDSGGFVVASGTTSWNYQLNTALYANTSHTITAKATDASGNSTVASTNININNSTSPTTPPNTQGKWVSPDGVTIIVNSAAPWTISQIYNILLAQTSANASAQKTFKALEPQYTLNVQDQYASMTVTSFTSSGGINSNFNATTYLKGTSSSFSSWPDYVLSHEYGVVWSQYAWALYHQANWSPYTAYRADGSTHNGNTYQYLGQDPLLGTSQTWDVREIVADDYRLLFGSPLAISERPFGVNSAITEPRNQAGLANWLLTIWAQ